jgi:hypothetical protein
MQKHHAMPVPLKRKEKKRTMKCPAGSYVWQLVATVGKDKCSVSN